MSTKTDQELPPGFVIFPLAAIAIASSPANTTIASSPANATTDSLNTAATAAYV